MTLTEWSKLNNKNLLNEWDYLKNSDFMPYDVSFGSDKKVWWKCERGHEYQEKVSKRTLRNFGCPYCSNHKILKGYNDLATTNPELLEEWDYEKNENIKPTEVFAGSSKEVWWKCKNGHEWIATIFRRKNGSGCPYCSNQKVLKGYNDFETLYPDLAEEWNYEKNAPLLPSQIVSGGDKVVWWKCKECGFEWKTQIKVRTKLGNGCPNCFKYHSTSFNEQAVLFYIKKSEYKVENSVRINGLELDIFIPELKTGIEYDGLKWHKDILDRDNNKDEVCENEGIKLIRIREKGLEKTKSAINLFRESRSNDDLNKIIKKLIDYLKLEPVFIDVKKDRNEIISSYIISKKDNSLQEKYPELLKEWNYEKNQMLKPNMITPFYNDKVWWKCSDCGFEWEASPANRVMGTGCPKCSLKRASNTRKNNILQNGGSFADKNPELLEEWDYDKNTIDPYKVNAGSGESVWWKCKNGHSWRTTIENRNKKIGCPYCSGRYRVKGVNDLKTLYPDLCEEWDYGKNIELTPDEIAPGSSTKVWWKCKEGHSWEATVANRALRGQKCPYCSGKKVISGENDLATKCPELLEEWDYGKNANVFPNKIMPGTHKKVWWKCKNCGLEWETAVRNRAILKTGCPSCNRSKRKI